MVTTLTALLPLLLTFPAKAQSGEFTVHPNGYIYSEAAMAQLLHIVDSLNIRFRACTVDRSYRSLPHARGRTFIMQKGNSKALAQDINTGMDPDELLRRYPSLQRGPERLCAFLRYTDREGQERTAVIPISFTTSMSPILNADTQALTGPQQGTWLVERSKYNEEHLSAFLVTEEPVSTELPERYGRLVQYVDCLIDSTSQVYQANAQWSGRRWGGDNEKRQMLAKLLEMVDKAITATPPEWYGDEEEDMQRFAEDKRHYRVVRAQQMDALAESPEFRKALDAALRESLEGGFGDMQLEELVSRYKSKADALALKRNRRVMGMCSMDSSPRDHALDIASLAAESVSWDIFLRAHLDIMNDNFSRASDGSYALEARQTYIAELEALQINVSDLLLGTLLHVDNVGEGHYTASASRTGRALTESQEAEAVAQRVLTMIADPELDWYNRAVFYYLFLNYNGHLEDEAAQGRNRARLESAMKGIPMELRDTRK